MKRQPPPTATLRERKIGLLWFGTRQEDRWSITDPEADELITAIRRLKGYDAYTADTRGVHDKAADIAHVLRAAEDYIYLTTYDLGVEHVIGQLRAIWRAPRRTA